MKKMLTFLLAATFFLSTALAAETQSSQDDPNLKAAQELDRLMLQLMGSAQVPTSSAMCKDISDAKLETLEHNTQLLQKHHDSVGSARWHHYLGGVYEYCVKSRSKHYKDRYAKAGQHYELGDLLSPIKHARGFWHRIATGYWEQFTRDANNREVWTELVTVCVGKLQARQDDLKAAWKVATNGDKGYTIDSTCSPQPSRS